MNFIKNKILWSLLVILRCKKSNGLFLISAGCFYWRKRLGDYSPKGELQVAFFAKLTSFDKLEDGFL
jgi:hypothetical protein